MIQDIYVLIRTMINFIKQRQCLDNSSSQHFTSQWRHRKPKLAYGIFDWRQNFIKTVKQEKSYGITDATGSEEARHRGTKRSVNTRENTESVHELVLSQESRCSRIHIDQCVKSQSKPTTIITVTKFPLFGHNSGNCDFQYQNSTINNSYFANILKKAMVIIWWFGTKS